MRRESQKVFATFLTGLVAGAIVLFFALRFLPRTDAPQPDTAPPNAEEALPHAAVDPIPPPPQPEPQPVFVQITQPDPAETRRRVREARGAEEATRQRLALEAQRNIDARDIENLKSTIAFEQANTISATPALKAELIRSEEEKLAELRNRFFAKYHIPPP
jgi:hypothetical protein